MPEQLPEICAINISVQQLVIAYLALGQGLSGHHASAHTLHVWRIPMFMQDDGNVLA